MLTSGRYKGDPVAVHGQVAGTEVELFERWLPLFDETCRELFVPDIADLFASKAVCIAESRQAHAVLPDGPALAAEHAMTFVVADKCIKCK